MCYTWRVWRLRWLRLSQQASQICLIQRCDPVCVCVCVCVWMRQAGVSGPADDVCIIYAELRAGVVAGSEQRQVLVCGRQTRHKLVYSSHSADQLQVAIHAAPSATEPIYFMLEFQGLSAAPCGLQGCRNRPAPFPGRTSNKATKPGSVCPVS